MKQPKPTTGDIDGPLSGAPARGVYVDDVRIGTFTRDDPADWSADSCDFHKNDSSWCKGSLIGNNEYQGQPLPKPDNQDECLCWQISLRLESRGSEVRRSTS